MAIILDNDDAARRLSEVIVEIVGTAIHVPAKVLEAARQHLGNLVALGVFCFGVWKWWVHRQQILHLRLEEYLRENDLRLIGGRNYVLNALQRPGPGQKFKLPLFAVEPLRNVLRERNWHRSSASNSIETSADWQLAKAVEGVRGQLEIANEMVSSLRLQLATANILRGAIASSTAQRSTANGGATDMVALNHFRSALNGPNHEICVLAKELEAHQLRKLGYLQQALDAYLEVEKLAPQYSDLKSQRLAVARSKRYQAELLQVMAYQNQADGGDTFPGVMNAWRLIRPTSDVDTAIKIRSRFSPYEDWDLIDQGDLHYFAAFIAHNLNFGPRENEQLTSARAAYSDVKVSTEKRRWRRDSKRKLRETAETALVRVENAQLQGAYDSEWLLPALNNSK